MFYRYFILFFIISSVPVNNLIAAEFNASNGILFLESVEVGSDYYEATLQLDTELIFDLQSATLTTQHTPDAIFNSAQGVVNLYRIYVNGTFFNATLQVLGSNRFTANNIREVTALEGQWKTACIHSNVTGDDFIWTIAVTESSFLFHQDVYNPSSNCSGAIVHKLDYYHNIKDSSQSFTVNNEGTFNLDLELKQILFTPTTSTAVSIFNALSFCGLNDWILNQATDLTGNTSISKCPASLSDSREIGSQSFALSKVDSNILKLSTFVSNEEDRPDVFDFPGSSSGLTDINDVEFHYQGPVR